MSITTRTGDGGKASVLLGGRVPKSHPRLVAVGDLDELNAALGLAHLSLRRPDLQEILRRVQQEIVPVMGMVSTGSDGMAQYRERGFRILDPAGADRLTRECAMLESEFPDGFHDWSVPGAKGGEGPARLEMARCIARRAERSMVALEADLPEAGSLLVWINRLSDFLWLAARCEEQVT